MCSRQQRLNKGIEGLENKTCVEGPGPRSTGERWVIPDWAPLITSLLDMEGLAVPSLVIPDWAPRFLRPAFWTWKEGFHRRAS